ncbi:MAG: hypothetical protein U1F68_05550 [Gammaproteobacteria bacterium]
MLLSFYRYYNSSAATVGSGFAAKWRHTYSRTLWPSATLNSTIAYVYRPDGKVFIFTLNTGLWQSDTDVKSVLTRLIDQANNPIGWQYKVAETDEVELYDVNGSLISITDRSGLKQTLTYSDGSANPPNGGVIDGTTNPLPAGLLIRVSDDFGHTLQFGYNANKYIVRMTNVAGQSYAYGYAANGNLMNVSYPDNKVRTYHYENVNFPQALTGVTDENNNRYATWSYDTQGRAISSEHANGADHTTLTYNADGTTTVTDALGTARTYGFADIQGVLRNTFVSQPCPGCGGASSAATAYDANGNIASRIDFNGNKTTYGYDLTRNLEVTRTEGLTSAGANTPATRTITTIWHPTFRLPTEINEVTAGKKTTLAYDAKGNLTSRTVTDTAINQTRTWTYTNTYSATVPGALTRVVIDGPRTDVVDTTTLDYYTPNDPCTGLGCRGQLKTSTNALGQITTVSQYYANGRPLTIVDPNGVTTTLSYHPRGWLTSRTVGGETTPLAMTS